VLLDTIAITPDNIQDPLVKEGFLDASDICTGKYAEPCKEAGVQ
jgi:D-xylose transport system substrate-binding protein